MKMIKVRIRRLERRDTGRDALWRPNYLFLTVEE